jgi:glycosyltransferase involved in cell wall biosynthesis
VLAIGTLEPRKNLPRLVAAFGRVTAEHADAKLVIAGKDASDRGAIDAAIAALAPASRERIVMAGAVDDATRRGLLAGAGVVAYPSVYEGFGFPVLEAMASSVPVVTTRAGAIPEVAGDAALLVDPTDVDGLATAIIDALSDEHLRADLVERGLARVQRYSWTATAASLADVYRQLAR